jgi:hypothetical protein
MAGPAAFIVSISHDNHMIFGQPISIEMTAFFVLCPQNLRPPCARCGYREAHVAAPGVQNHLPGARHRNRLKAADLENPALRQELEAGWRTVYPVGTILCRIE